VIWVKITARNRWVLMAGHALEKVQLDAGVDHPGQRRVPQAVPHATGQPQIINQLVPPPSIAQGRGRDHPSTRPTSRRASLTLPPSVAPRREHRLDDRHRTTPQAIGVLGDQAAAAGVGLPPHVISPLVRPTSRTSSPATSLNRDAVVAKIITQLLQA
jgi:hypothetical protein